MQHGKYSYKTSHAHNQFYLSNYSFKMKSGMDYDNPLQVVKSSMSVSDQNTRYLFLAHGYMKKH